MRITGAFLAAGLVAGCLGSGGSLGSGSNSSGIRWSGPSGADPFYRGPYAFGGSRYGNSYGNGRTFSPRSGVVCDRVTETCYRGRDIDASETKDNFGRSAARRVDRIRDQAGTNRIYRASDDVVCNRRDKVCYKNGHADRSETRDYFGKKAARRID